jgi:adenylylsulfate kinase
VQKGITVWFTGLSGSGKTTLCNLIQSKLNHRNIKVELLDGDVVREHLSSDLGFSKEDRQKNIERVAFLANLLSRNGIIVLASFISPYQKTRDYCRDHIDSFIEVYVKCSIDECIRRDVKGLYQKALKGEIKQFTGISDPFEEPISPEVTVETETETIEESANKVMEYLEHHGYI